MFIAIPIVFGCFYMFLVFFGVVTLVAPFSSFVLLSFSVPGLFWDRWLLGDYTFCSSHRA